MISKGDKDEILVYFLAFKLHCFKGEQDEALEMFEQMQQSEHELDTNLLLEIFNVIVSKCPEMPGSSLTDMTTLCLNISNYILGHFSNEIGRNSNIITIEV